MTTQIQHLAALSAIDLDLDDYEEEFGDLPDQIKVLDNNAKKHKSIVSETLGILSEVKKFTAAAKTTLKELKEKETQLSEKQFKVRNNKEFDAITKEIEHIRQERSRLTNELRNAALKDENLVAVLVGQKSDLEEAEAALKEKEAEMDLISSDQNVEVKKLRKKKNDVLKKLEQSYIDEYLRVRTQHNDAVVQIRKNCCSGCFSLIPSQKIVLIRNAPEKIFSCENCGRILYPES